MKTLFLIAAMFAGWGFLSAALKASATPERKMGFSDPTPVKIELDPAFVAAEQPKEVLVLVGKTKAHCDELGIAHLTGTIKNVSGRDLNYAEVLFRITDASGAQVDTVLANTRSLPAGGRWKFDGMTGCKVKFWYTLDHVSEHPL
jgi:hypothetical protein